MQERGYTSQNMVASAAQTDLSTMDGFLAEVKLLSTIRGWLLYFGRREKKEY